MSSWNNQEPKSVVETLIDKILSTQQLALLDKLAASEPDLNTLLAIRAEAIVINQVEKQMKAECIRALNPERKSR